MQSISADASCRGKKFKHTFNFTNFWCNQKLTEIPAMTQRERGPYSKLKDSEKNRHKIGATERAG